MSVFIFPDHHEQNTTYLVGEWIKNGCTTFNIKDIDKVCGEHLVLEKHRKEVLDAYNPNDFTYNLAKYVHHSDYEVRRLIAKNGVALEILRNDENEAVRLEVFLQGVGDPNDIKDMTWHSRHILAFNGIHTDYVLEAANGCGVIKSVLASKGHCLDKLYTDSNEFVRCAVAERGSYLDALINDKSMLVRLAVAEQGYGLDILVNDQDYIVRKQAQQLIDKGEQND